jgi:large subunit ribosomal protein L5
MTTATETKTTPRLKERYRNEIVAKLREQYDYGNPMQVPRMVKIVVNMGVGEAARDAKLIDGAVRDLATITGQKPQVRRATKSIAQFNRQRGMDITVVTTATTDDEGRALLKLLGFPFKEN